MALNSTQTPDDEDTGRDSDADPWTSAKRTASTIRRRDSNGTISILAGVAMLVWMTRSARRSKGRAALKGLAGAALLKHGVGKRRSGVDVGTDERDGHGAEDDEKDESDEAYAHRQRSDVLGQAETNPRGTSGEPDVETETDPDEGSIQFTEEQAEGPRSEPHLDEEDAQDPRVDDEDDQVEIDLSEAAMADEASEATGPTSEQAQPASTEGTEPEPTPAEDASHVQADVPDDDAEEEVATDETGDDESEGEAAGRG